jgi:hypothetical protein
MANASRSGRHTNDNARVRSVRRALAPRPKRSGTGELERQCERLGLGLDPLPPEDGGGTFDELMQGWLDTYSAGSPSHRRNKFSVEKNLIGSELGALTLMQVTPAIIEVFLQARAAGSQLKR